MYSRAEESVCTLTICLTPLVSSHLKTKTMSCERELDPGSINPNWKKVCVIRRFQTYLSTPSPRVCGTIAVLVVAIILIQQLDLGKRDILQRAVKPEVTKSLAELGLAKLLRLAKVEPQLLV